MDTPTHPEQVSPRLNITLDSFYSDIFPVQPSLRKGPMTRGDTERGQTRRTFRENPIFTILWRFIWLESEALWERTYAVEKLRDLS